MNKKITLLLLIVLMVCGIASAQDAGEPSITISADTTKGTAPLTVNFTAVVSDPFDGIYAVTYEWYFDDNTASTGKNPKHTFVSAKSYNVICRVTFWSYPKKTVEAGIEIIVGRSILVCTAVGDQSRPKLTSDGAGGGIITWQDSRTENGDIYAQRVLGNGNLKWTLNGNAIGKAGGNNPFPHITSDGAGGGVIVWRDFHKDGGDIYAQRVLGDGSAAWISSGLAICTANGSQYGPNTASGSSGGNVIVWADHRGGGSDIYAQRVLNDGSLKWASNGIPLCTAGGNQNDPHIVSDGSGGAIAVWWDYRTGLISDIYAQRVLIDGSLKGAPDGIPICTQAGRQDFPHSTPDGAGGAVIVWRDYRNGPGDIYAQRVLNDGSLDWTLNGLAVCTAGEEQYSPLVTNDGSGGNIIAWLDRRGGNYIIYAQRVLNDGTIKWTPNGIAMNPEGSTAYLFQIISDGTGGAFIMWNRYRVGSYDILAQHVDIDGKLQWGAAGSAISVEPFKQYNPRMILNEFGGILVTWSSPTKIIETESEDYYIETKEAEFDIYALHIDKNGKKK